ncbi:zinc-ribbon and DUF3426 domain-containing protein [Roseateles amylovorans]|uniref:DUF3426 domain-containing protein n=1 Tax=Roseateles amylovorans TaxID=2978473 RepID=A0ABY6B0N2_9BURK|nr:zinc-ribbon and DUF3426 domain-containing protein [Roseateles amylovorans]UXH77736.1 DUF3426 domain-containing protein [Roseateles amylovorans]
MNLATRCTTCGTIFRVVQDQLRVSEGWVRCGRCAEVFDAREQLFDLERDSPPPWPPQSAAPTAAAARPTQTVPPPPTPQPPPQAAPARAAVPAPPYQPYQGDFRPSQAGALTAREADAPVPRPAAPKPVAPTERFAPPMSPPAMAPRASTFSPSSFMPAAPDTQPPAFESSWLANDDDELNPFAPPRHYSHEDDSELPTPEVFEARREPFFDTPTPAPAPDPRSHLPEPKGMRFEEDELPPPIPDDERPDVLLALSPATAAQLHSQEPSFDPSPAAAEPVPAPAEPPAEDTKAAKKARKKAKRTEEAQADAPMATPAAMPNFLRQAESAQRWHRPAVRIALGTVATLLGLSLVGQGVWHSREAIAAQYPGVRPTLVTVARAMGQELRPWQHIEALSVESSSLNPAGGGDNHYRLSLSLRNRSNWDVAQPWVDLSLTDAAGQLVVRRMLSPAELQATKPAMSAGTDQQAQVVFDSGALKISGYTVELFYP